MEDRDWLIIKVLHEQKNITKTAQVLFISQPALTARIRQIEQEFDVKMVYRGSRGIHFTPEGDYLAECAQNMLTNIRQIKEQVVSMGTDIKGTLLVGSPNYLTKFKLPRLLGLFKEQYPNVEFNVVTAWSSDICSLLQNQDIHVGFVRMDHGWRGEKHILHEEPICIASKQEIKFNDLPQLPRIDYQTDVSYKMLLNNWWGKNFSQSPKIGMTVSHLDICKGMVVNGLGYAIVPSTIFKNDENIHQIALMDNDGKPILRQTLIMYQKEMLELKMVRRFIDFAKTVDFNNLI
ncbi:LysR family transcriptional regulator [Pelosinus propionicus]|uniref:DNA-binding transcriptional regulator, LysR family n=1 Tax=Pelosinus propionicus DSM 13327 TaxID=1123291 RepID=A0A1I4H3V2_9FIRM|nr:LysR family transcriptional regulator [Pelosinus propionicus]SFL36317.1 DNA-binding transcriptional regulator, LysR family [Pelosinus propionicus DSM 13327]